MSFLKYVFLLQFNALLAIGLWLFVYIHGGGLKEVRGPQAALCVRPPLISMLYRRHVFSDIHDSHANIKVN